MAAPGASRVETIGRSRGLQKQGVKGNPSMGDNDGKRQFIFSGRGRGRGGSGRGAAGRAHGVSAREGQKTIMSKRRWIQPQHKAFQGSAKEGHGFALWRKQKTQLDYKKLLRKQRKADAMKEVQYTDQYPEHLKHLYLAEEEMLKKQEKRKRPAKSTGQEAVADTAEAPKKKFQKKTSNQKAKEEYEKVQKERAKKREEAEKRRKEREEAQQLYKKKKMEAYKIISSKTKKGQPNFNLQMEYLLQKIQQQS